MQITTTSHSHTTIPWLNNRIDLQTSEASLPCRGCTVHCPDHSQCKAKPWRLAEAPGGNRMMKFGKLHK